jgi:hydroxylamine reductase (hybrid-cluster protein)
MAVHSSSGGARMCESAHAHFAAPATLDVMSERNGDRARFHKDRKRKLHHRQRIQALMTALRKRAGEEASTRVASLNMHDEGGPVRIED